MTLQPQAPRQKFRQDINGLRAIAVFSVLLFHFSPKMLPGGFVGVDIFFVISGFLMTSIIFRGIENKQFSYSQFIKNRAKRIIPALLAVTTILLIVGYITLGQDAYKMLGKHARDSLLFISNITYEKENGYFDVASASKLMLHTWSLSVEWQFYLIYPIILLAFNRLLSFKLLKQSVIILFALSFLLSLYITYKNPTSAYFQFYTRAWEMMLGGLAFLYPLRSIKPSSRILIELVGLVIIMCSFVVINRQTPWPGYMALLPVFGTYLCILANNPATFLKFYPINKIGLWSYSIYLVHWPILTYYFLLEQPLPISLYFFVTLLLSVALYYTVEKYRHYGWGLLITFCVVLSLAIYARETSGKERFNVPKTSQQSLAHGHQGWSPKVWRLFNAADNQSKVDYLIYGDSFNAQYTSYFREQKKSIANIYEGECLSSPNYFSYGTKCIDLYARLQQGVQQNHSDILVIAQSWSRILKGLKHRKTEQLTNYDIDEFIRHLKDELMIMKKDLGVQKIVLIGINNGFIGPSPEECISQKFVKDIYAKFYQRSNCQDSAPMQNTNSVEIFNQKLNQLAQAEDWLAFINPNDALCQNDQCIQIQNDLSLYSDPSHFSVIGAKIVGEFIFKELEKISENIAF